MLFGLQSSKEGWKSQISQEPPSFGLTYSVLPGSSGALKFFQAHIPLRPCHGWCPVFSCLASRTLISRMTGACLPLSLRLTSPRLKAYLLPLLPSKTHSRSWAPDKQRDTQTPLFWLRDELCLRNELPSLQSAALGSGKNLGMGHLPGTPAGTWVWFPITVNIEII